MKNSTILFDIYSENGNLKTKKKLPRPGSGIDTEFCSAILDVAESQRLSDTCLRRMSQPHSPAIDDIMSEIIFLNTKEFNPKFREFRSYDFALQNHIKEIKISHKYLIKELLVPEEYKKDAARIKAKRGGVIRRILEIDGKITRGEQNFLV